MSTLSYEDAIAMVTGRPQQVVTIEGRTAATPDEVAWLFSLRQPEIAIPEIKAPIIIPTTETGLNPTTVDLDGLSKPELIEVAKALGVKASGTVAELTSAIEAKRTEDASV